MASERYFFVLGMPRCRTAWLSVLLSGQGSFCFHEGTGQQRTFPEYVKMLMERQEPCVGDSNAALCKHIDGILDLFRDARFLIVRRNEEAALRSLCAADPANAPAVRAGWGDYLMGFELAAERIQEKMEVEFSDLASFQCCARIHEWLTGFPLDEVRWDQLRNLHITTTFPQPVSHPIPQPEINVEGFDFSGLTVRLYSPDDLPMIEAWWEAHKQEPMGLRGLPPLGLIVENGNGPAGALWCFETFGCGVAWLEMPITRPGLSFSQASNVMAFAAMAMVKLAGSGHEPKGDFRRFRACTTPAIARTLKRLGFVELATNVNLLLST